MNKSKELLPLGSILYLEEVNQKWENNLSVPSRTL